MEHMDSELAQGFIRGSLPQGAWFRWEAHLSICRRCRALVAHERSLAGLLKLDQEPSAPDDAVDRLLAQIEPQDRRRPAPRRGGRYLLAAGLAAVLGVALGLAYRLATTPASTELAGDFPAIRTDAQRDVVTRLDTLQTLGHDPWLADEYEAVRWLETLVRSDGGS